MTVWNMFLLNMKNTLRMRNNLYFVGGAKGVGKSSVLSHVKESIDASIVNTGDFFKREKLINASASSREVIRVAKQKLLDHIIRENTLIIDTHYAGFKDNIYTPRFERGLNYYELKYLEKNRNLEFILITIDPHTLYERRIMDDNNKRDYNFSNIQKELKANEKFFDKYCRELNKKEYRITNNDVKQSAKDIIKIIKG